MVQRQIAEKLLIHTKFNRPRVGEGWIPRRRLTARLEAGLDKRLTLISAPAGFGKTTLADQWLDQCPRPSAWLSLESDESDPERFLRYVVGAIQLIVPEFGAETKRLLSGVKLPPTKVLAESMISDLSALDTPIVLVLDDYHLVASKDVQEMVIRILTHLSGNIHLVFLTRVDPPWPLARWRTLGWTNELRAADLSFSQEETGIFFQKERFPPEIVRTVQEQTEGWAVGLRLLKLSLADVQDPQERAKTLSNKDHLIVDYLVDEVVAHQPAETLDFLAVTALFDRFCEPLCDFLLADRPDRQESGRLIARLESENLFLVPLDRERSWYRYHHLFRELILNHLTHKMDRDQRIHLQGLAGRWFANEGFMEEAIEQLVAAREYDEATVLIEKNLHDIMDKDLSRRQLKCLLKRFPLEVQDQHPGLLVARAYAALVTWDLPEVARTLEKAEVLLHDATLGLSGERRRSLQGDVDSMWSFLHFWRGNAEQALEHGQRAIEFVPQHHRYPRALAIMFTAGAYVNLGRREEALDLLAKAIVESESARSQSVGGLYLARTIVCLYGGDLQTVEDVTLRALETNKTFPITDYWIGYARYFLGRVAYERNCLDAAAEHFSRVVQLRYLTSSLVCHDSLMGLALVALARGQADRAREYAADARSFVLETNDPFSLRISDWFDLHLGILEGRVPDEPIIHSPAFDSNQPWLETPSLTHLECLIANASVDACPSVIRRVDDALQKAQQYHNTPLVIKSLAVKALALHGSGDLEGALQVIEETLRMAEPLGFVRTFVDRGPRMAELLKAFLKKEPRHTYARNLLNAFRDQAGLGRIAAESTEGDSPAQAPKTPAEAFLDTVLSNREIDVLLLLQERLTHKEIAERLFISSETVKRHTANIYRKLNVHGSREAVAAARTMGLLSP